MTRLSDLFEIKYGVNLEFNKMKSDPNGIPFISRQSKNNGMVERIRFLDGIEPNPANTISVSCGGSVLESYLQKEPYYSGRDLVYLKPKQKMSDKEMLLYCAFIRANKYRYNYGRQANRTLHDILVPHLDEVRKISKNIKTPSEPSKKALTNKSVFLTDRKWDKFEAANIFKICRGLTSITLDISEVRNSYYNVPYIRPSKNYDIKNGFLHRNDVSKYIYPKNSLVMGNTGHGSHTYTYLISEEFVPNNNLSVLEIIGHTATVFQKLFLIPIIEHNRYRYAYGRIPSTDRFLNSTIKLPVDKQGIPDWQFMEDYIKNLPYSTNL